MNFPHYLAVAIAEREREAEIDRLTQFAAAVCARCSPPRFARIVAAMRRTPPPCNC